MRFTVLYSENLYADDSVERRIYGPDVRVIFPQAANSLADLSDADCAAADGLMIMRFKVTADGPAALSRSCGRSAAWAWATTIWTARQRPSGRS